jgi:hypothetical protein
MLSGGYDSLTEHPLRHLWSLGVEEHFYLVFPLLVVLVLRLHNSTRRARRLMTVTVVVAVLSWVMSFMVRYGTQFNFAFEDQSERLRVGFFFSPLRFWELLIGVLTASIPKPTLVKSSRTILRVGAMSVRTLSVLTILFGFVSWKNPESFPDVRTLLVVIPMAFLLYVPSSFLASPWTKPLQFLGNISYSLYLYHWPVFVLVNRELSSDMFSKGLGLITAIVLAYFAHRFVEVPWTSGRRSLQHLAVWGAMALTVVACAVFLGRSSFFYSIFPKSEDKMSNFASAIGCGDSPDSWQTKCLVMYSQTKSPVILLMGDSNARSASDGIAAAVQKHGLAVIFSVRSACPAIVDIGWSNPECESLNDSRFELIQNSRPDLVIIVNHWSNYLESNTQVSELTWTQDHNRTINFLRQNQVPMIFQLQIPKCQASNTLLNKIRATFGDIGAYACDAEPRDHRVQQAIGDNLKRKCDSEPRNCAIIDAEEIVCSVRCQVFQNDRMIFCDQSHLCPSGSLAMANEWFQLIAQALSLESTK